MADRLELLIGISGPICAGKTTMARFLERRGFAYSRFSLVIDEEVAKQGLPLNRQNRQAVGLDLHERLGQAYIAERALRRVIGSRLAVIDGLRFDEDLEFFAGRFASRFLHVHVYASREIRHNRYLACGESIPFDKADEALVERRVSSLGRDATANIKNESSLEMLFQSAESVIVPANEGA